MVRIGQLTNGVLASKIALVGARNAAKPVQHMPSMRRSKLPSTKSASRKARSAALRGHGHKRNPDLRRRLEAIHGAVSAT